MLKSANFWERKHFGFGQIWFCSIWWLVGWIMKYDDPGAWGSLKDSWIKQNIKNNIVAYSAQFFTNVNVIYGKILLVCCFIMKTTIMIILIRIMIILVTGIGISIWLGKAFLCAKIQSQKIYFFPLTSQLRSHILLEKCKAFLEVIETPTENYQIDNFATQGVFSYEKVSDVPESRVWFASKNLTPCRMHLNDFLIAQIIAKCHSFPNMYDML